MRGIVFVSCLLLLTFCSYSQNTFLGYLNNAEQEIGSTVLVEDDTTFLFCSSIGFGVGGMALTKTDKFGAIIWRKEYSSGIITGAPSITKSVNNSYLLVGSSQPAGILAINVSSTGAINWSQRYECAWSGSQHHIDVIEVSNGGYLIAASSPLARPTVIRIDQLGGLLWGNLLTGSTSSSSQGLNHQCSVIETSTGDFLIGTVTNLIAAGQYNYSGTLFKVNPSGNIEWVNNIGGNNADAMTEVVEALDGNYVVLGQTESYGAGAYDVILSKFAQNGDLIWSKIYGIGDDQVATSMVQLGNGDLIIAGSTGNLFSSSGYYGMVMKVNSSGNFQWANKIAHAMYVNDITISPDNSFVISGAGYGNWSTVYIGKMDSTGSFGCELDLFVLNEVNITPTIAHDYTVLTDFTEYSHINTVNDIFDTENIICSWDPNAPYITGEDTICVGDSVTLTVHNESIHSWSTSTAPSIVIGTDSTITVSPSQTITYWHHGADTTYFVLHVISMNPISLGADTIACEGQPFSLNAGNQSADYLWSTNQTQHSINVTNPGLYWVTLTNLCGSTSDSIYVGFESLPSLNLPMDTLICLNNILELNFDSNFTYTLNDTLDGSSFTIQEAGMYIVSTQNSCGIISDSILVNFEYCSEGTIVMPNIFSPNGDMINDYFFPELTAFTLNELVILNRWGQIVYQSDQISPGWDGSFNGDKCSEGTYFWRIDVSNEADGMQETLHGFLQLVR